MATAALARRWRIPPPPPLRSRLPTESDDLIRASPYIASIAHTPAIRRDFPPAVIARVRADLNERRFARAFRAIEGFLAPERFLVFMEVVFGAGIERPFRASELVRNLDAFAARARGNPWPVLFKTFVLYRMERVEEALEASRPLLEAPASYGWMRIYRALIYLLYHCDYARAEKELKAVLRAAPRMWRAHAYRAEILVCRGRLDEALRLLDGVLGQVSGLGIADVRAWRGELLLWAGEYRRALPDLDYSAEHGVNMSFCWRGAAYMGLGERRRALRELDAGLELIPVDREALTLRGEARRLLGDLKGARADLDYAVRLVENPFWALANRALLRAKTEGRAGLLEDLRAMDPAVVAFFEHVSGLEAGEDAPLGSLCRLLEAGLKRWPGMRRTDRYLFPVWMR